MTFGLLKAMIDSQKRFKILKNIISTVLEKRDWVPYSDIDNNLSASLGVITRFSTKMNLIPFLEYDGRYNYIDNEETSMQGKGKGRIRMPKISEALFESVLKDNEGE